MTNIKICTIIIIVLLLYLIFSRNTVENFSDNPYDFIKYINNWNKRFKNLTYNGMTHYDICQDKYNSYLYCNELGVPTPDLYFYGDINDVNFNELPDSYVIKSTRGAGSKLVFPIKNGINQFSNATDIQDIINKLQNKKCIIEEFIKNEDSEYEIPDDYKIFCFNGIPEIIWKKRFINNKYYSKYYDINWNVLPLIGNAYKEDSITNIPINLHNMINYATKIGNIFNNVHIRLDFYSTDKGIVFGEFTPHCTGGKGFTNYGKKYLNNLMKKHDIKYNDNL